MVNKEHLTMEGLKKILSFKYSMNLGLSEGLKKNFTEIIPVERPKFLLTGALIFFLYFQVS